MQHERSIQLWIEWVPRENNLLADALSKYHDRDDWMLNSKYFRILDKLWGPHTFDRFQPSSVSSSTAGFGALAQPVSMHLLMIGLQRRQLRRQIHSCLPSLPLETIAWSSLGAD